MIMEGIDPNKRGKGAGGEKLLADVFSSKILLGAVLAGGLGYAGYKYISSDNNEIVSTMNGAPVVTEQASAARTPSTQGGVVKHFHGPVYYGNVYYDSNRPEEQVQAAQPEKTTEKTPTPAATTAVATTQATARGSRLSEVVEGCRNIVEDEYSFVRYGTDFRNRHTIAELVPNHCVQTPLDNSNYAGRVVNMMNNTIGSNWRSKNYDVLLDVEGSEAVRVAGSNLPEYLQETFRNGEQEDIIIKYASPLQATQPSREQPRQREAQRTTAAPTTQTEYNIRFRDSDICYVPGVEGINATSGNLEKRLLGLPRVGRDSEMRLLVDNSQNPRNYTIRNDMDEIRRYVDSGAKHGICILKNDNFDDTIVLRNGPHKYNVRVRNGEAGNKLMGIVNQIAPSEGSGRYHINIESPGGRGESQLFAEAEYKNGRWHFNDVRVGLWPGETTAGNEVLHAEYRKVGDARTGMVPYHYK